LIYVEESKNVTLVEQTGLLSHQFYGDDFFYLPQKEKYLKQKKTEYDIIKKGRPVYYTSEPEGDFPGYNAVQTGLIYKIVPENSSVGNTQYWERYDFSEIANTTINLDYMTQQIKVIYYVRLAQYYLLEDRGRAAYLLETAVKISPDDATLRYDLGNVYLGLGRIDDAIEQFKKALVRNPELPKAMNNLGYAYGLKGEKNTALKYHMTALSLDPEYTTARFNVAGILMTHGRYVEAYKHYQLIVKTEPTYAKAYLNMGLISYKMNQTNEAATYFEKYLVLDPQSDNADEIREEIRRIRGENATKQ
ncbi:MAG: tetratricopeptide repeat protein, partial [Candidatus Altiarchaeota archaeon]|nr:tetratricopeptide repeat protein [Candidatus Altiarchaeota archaeon]